MIDFLVSFIRAFHRPKIGLPTIAILAALSLACEMPPAAASTPASETVRAVFLNPGKRGEVFWDMVTSTMRVAAMKLNIDLEVVYAERNYRTMQTLGLEITRRPQLPQFLILANEDDAGVRVLEAADAVGIRTLLISSDIAAKDWERLGGPREVLRNWIGALIPDMEAAGSRMARALITEARQKRLFADDGKLHLLVLSSDMRTPTAIQRHQGLDRFVATEADVVVDRTLPANWNAADAEAATRKYLAWAHRSGIRVAGVWAANDPMALGAIKALREAGLTPGRDVMVVGLNWSREAIEHVHAGTMVMTDGGHFLMGTWSMIMLRDFVDGCDPFRPGVSKSLPTAAVTRDTAGLMLTLLGKRRYARVDVAMLRSKFGDSCRPYDFSIEAYAAALGAAK